ncbi:hypothetical protein [Roseomonas chloroacetimidivorans]|uniref:hypothetical protein n=1 Tax=Roseomonas chloroacetimidivorans TaxID=1766656 RepID=UPI003C734D6C
MTANMARNGDGGAVGGVSGGRVGQGSGEGAEGAGGPSTYTIRSVKDFLDVPLDRLDECLREFGLWLAIGHAYRGVFEGVELLNVPHETFIWVDDGKGEVSIRVSTPDGEEVYREVFTTAQGVVESEGRGGR